MPEQSLAEIATGYASIGWPIFPIKAGEKVPLTVRGFKDATTDADRIKTWWERWPNAGIGLATGEPSGVMVLDIDPRNGGNESLETILAKHGPLPETAECITGGGGRHVYFLHVPGTRCGKVADGIDRKADGGYVVLPCSLHPSGNTYEWEQSSTPELVGIADAPAWLVAGSQPKPAGTGNLTQYKLDINTPVVASENINRAKAYIAACPDAVSGEGGHNATLHAACMCYEFGLNDAEAYSVMCWYNLEKCHPQWNDKQIRHKLEDARKKVAADNKLGCRVAPVTLEVIEVSDEESIPAPVPVASKFPPALLQPPGMVGEIAAWINRTAMKPQPPLALGNALAFWGAVIGRKVRTETNARSNLYCLGVGESGCGKDHSRRCIKEICEAAGLTSELLGAEEIASDSAIMAAVNANPSLLFQLDEIGHFLANANSKYSGTHLRNIAPTFTKLFSSAGGIMIGKAYATAERKDVVQPNVCMYGTTVPGRLYEGLSPGEITDGFLGRMLVFKSDDPDPIEQDVIAEPPPERIVQMVGEWHNRKDLPRDGRGNIAAALNHIPHIVPFDDEARAVLKRFGTLCREKRAKHRGGVGFDVLWARASEHAMKVALTVACGVEYQAPRIMGDVMEWSVALVGHVIDDLVATVEQSVAGSEFERQVMHMERIIREGPIGGISQTELIGKSRRYSPAVRKSIIETLIDSGRVTKVSRKNKTGSPTTIYRIGK